MIWILMALLTILAVGCKPEPRPVPLTQTCEGACKVLGPKSESNPHGLGCPEGDPTPLRGIPCDRWCSDYHALGYLKPWDACVAASTSEDEVRVCGVKCER